jgi:hypothetical protein
MSLTLINHNARNLETVDALQAPKKYKYAGSKPQTPLSRMSYNLPLGFSGKENIKKFYSLFDH